MAIKYLRRTEIIAFTAILVKIVCFFGYIKYNLDEPVYVQMIKKLVSIPFVNRPKDKKLSRQLKEKGRQAIICYTLVS
jgi:hypothetical protein